MQSYLEETLERQEQFIASGVHVGVKAEGLIA